MGVLSWNVKNFDFNRQKIVDYDVLAYREDFIKKLKKKCSTKDEFAQKLRTEFMCKYWSRAEYELIIKKTEDNRILLKPWVGCWDDEAATIDVTDDESFDWRSFAEQHIGSQIYENEAKIDIYSQLRHKLEEFVDYCWYTRLPYERNNPKFDR